MEPHSHAPQPQPSRVECPRCGFALDGSRDASRARGETEGICTECGLSVEWRQLEDASGDPAWFVESRLKPLGLARRAIATLLRLAWPWGFWSQVSMRTPLSARGIAAFLLVLACVAHGVAAVGRIERNAPRWGRTAPGTVDHIVAVVTPLNRYYGTSIMISARLPDPPSSAWERTIRIAHGFVYSIDFTGLVPPRPGLHPFAPQIVDPVTTSRLASAALVPVLAPCMLLLLPISMRRARVRFRHIARAAIYSLALLVPLFALALYACIANWHLYIGTQDWIGRMRPHVLTIAAALVTLPWLAAIVARYLRLPRAWPVALACTAIATLLSLAVSALQFDRL
jgi:hypothetical protein